MSLDRRTTYRTARNDIARRLSQRKLWSRRRWQKRSEELGKGGKKRACLPDCRTLGKETVFRRKNRRGGPLETPAAITRERLPREGDLIRKKRKACNWRPLSAPRREKFYRGEVQQRLQAFTRVCLHRTDTGERPAMLNYKSTQGGAALRGGGSMFGCVGAMVRLPEWERKSSQSNNTRGAG